MTEGPPPWAASSSGPTPSSTPSKTSTPNPSASPVPAVVPYSNPSGPTPYPYASWGTAWTPNYSSYSQGCQGAPTGLSFPPNPSSSPKVHQPPSQSQPYNPYTHLVQPAHTSTPTTNATSTPSASRALDPSPIPPLPEPETYKHWDEVIGKFLRRTRMNQAVKGLRADILVLNPDWEQQTVPDALRELANGLQTILDRMDSKLRNDSMQVDGSVDTTANSLPEERSLEDRKLDYIHLANGMKPRSQSSCSCFSPSANHVPDSRLKDNKSISQFLARTRSRNDASNRAEFLHTLAEKKRQVLSAAAEDLGSEDGAQAMEISSCARVDARPIDRDKQIKYDIYNNAEGPLTRRVKVDAPANEQPSNLPISAQPNPAATPEGEGQPRRKRKLGAADELADSASVTELPSRSEGKRSTSVLEKGNGDEVVTAERHPGLDERVRNVEAHLAMRYVPSPPRTLLARLKYIEDHIVKLEKEYPPWAALHFNQPNRGWPPPPRATPVIVPLHLRSVTPASTITDPSSTIAIPSTSALGPTKGNSGVVAPGSASGTSGKQRNKDSSLRKAVLDRLEVQRAMSEMSGKGGQAS
ncbi:unnamed protein product [Cyclocybe aegerita]|uniref:Uncharacterized protein n=1 Tax=Cyclocybe aegerita TaxID=1973307 RepID=A0A8S0W374_CYCAE|nr:unnamed protein product [Cyclocybe aegerita]